MSRQPESARRHLGEDLWTELRAAPDPYASRDVPGPTLARLQFLVQGVESI
jgi:hypothetical protein